MDIERFTTHSLRNARLMRILSAALDAVEPGAAVRRFLESHPLPHAKRLFGLAVGKAAVPMMDALQSVSALDGGLAITKHAPLDGLRPYRLSEGAHPVPDGRSVAAGEAALDFVHQLTPDDLLVCLISGGGSALMSAPLLPLPQLQKLTSALLASGARIDEINTLRRHLDRVKGGGLAAAGNGARILSLILSDVVGNPLEAIASGPTAPDPTTRADALRLMQSYHLEGPGSQQVSAAMRETLKPGDPIFSRVENVIIGSIEIAAQAALAQAGREGFDAELLTASLQGEAREVGRELAGRLRSERGKRSGPFCAIAGGETTVTLHGRGRGGRNQELALSAVPVLRGLEDALLLSLATDGEDGPTDAAGAVVTGESMARALSLGLDAGAALAENDSYPFFEALGDLIRTGPTGTNVNDLVVMASGLGS
ncbi:MAG: glycerate kinase type-2 family protein [Bacteroidota bacterium]